MPSTTKDVNLFRKFPAVLIKNIRAVATVAVYDLLLRQDSMKQEEQWRFCYNSFHGNEDKNMSSQIKLLVSGFGPYKELFYLDIPGQVTDRDTQSAEELNADDTTNIRVLKDMFLKLQRKFSKSIF